MVGAEVYREYGGMSCVLRLAGTWILLVTGGGPTEDKPEVTFAVAADPSRVDHAFTMRVADCQAAYEHASCARRGVPDAAGQLGVGDARLLPRSGRPPARDQRGTLRGLAPATSRYDAPMEGPRGTTARLPPDAATQPLILPADAPARGRAGGAPLRREGPAKLTGLAKYADDLVFPGAWYGATIRSTEPHARLLGIELDDGVRLEPGRGGHRRRTSPATTSSA